MEMKPYSCFGYEAVHENYKLRDGCEVVALRESCKPLEIMQCRRHSNAEKVCRFFKTPAQFESDAKEAERRNLERRKANGKAGEGRD